jgi:hypothetical protein
LQQHKEGGQHQQPQQQHKESEQQPPFVLLHGVGMGLVPYVSFMFQLAAVGEVRVRHWGGVWVSGGWGLLRL